MTSKRFAIIFVLTVLVAQSGCSTISQSLGQKNAAATKAVSVTPWLGQSISVPIPNNLLTLADALTQPKIANQRATLAIAADGLKEAGKSVHFNIEDNCVVLTRGNDHYYFLEPIGLLELYAGSITLKPGDKIFTTPLKFSKFFTPRPQGVFEYVKIEAGGMSQKVPVNPNLLSSDSEPPEISNLESQDPESWWTVSVVTRFDGSDAHHLILPANYADTNPLRGTLTFSSKLAQIGTDPRAAFFQPGDILVKTHFSQFVERL